MTKKFYIETYGCQMNVADSEVVAAIIQTTNAEITECWEDADIIILNTCSIRDNAEQKVGARLRELKAHLRDLCAERQKTATLKDKRSRTIIGVIGCMAERIGQQLIDEYGVDFVAGPDAYLDIPNLLAQAEQGHKAMNVELSTTETYRQIIPTRIGRSISGFVSIMRGCNNFCSYCVVPYTRGRERSRDVESILAEVRDLQARGYKEVTLLGQNVNSYRYTPIVNGTCENGKCIDFADLLEIVADAVPDMRIRFTTSHPKDMSDKTLEAISRHKNLCNFIHLAVQSGSNHVLKLMNRKYTREWYLDRIAAMRLPRRDTGRSCRDTESDAGGWFRLSLHVQVFRATGHVRTQTPAGQHTRRRESAPTERDNSSADTTIAGIQPTRDRQDRRSTGGRLLQTQP